MKYEIGAIAAVGLVTGSVFLWVRSSSEKQPSSAVEASATIPEHHLATARMIAAGDQATGKPAVDFEALANDGKTYRLSELTRDGPVVLVFIKNDCPCSRSADEFLQRVHSAGRGWVRFLGVIDGGVDVASKWAEATNTVFPILADPQLQIIHAFGAENSAYVAFLGPGGRIERLWAGYSASMLRELATRMAPWVKTSLDPFDVSDAPSALYSGCPYDE